MAECSGINAGQNWVWIPAPLTNSVAMSAELASLGLSVILILKEAQYLPCTVGRTSNDYRVQMLTGTASVKSMIL